MRTTICVSCLLAVLLTGCGVSETAVAAAAAGKSKAEEIKQGQETMKQVQTQLDAANQQAEAQRKAAGQAAQ
jgi:hypothetical protein